MRLYLMCTYSLCGADMPSWDVHVKWALRMNIPRDVANYVNSVIDCSRYECPQDFIEFLLREFERDVARYRVGPIISYVERKAHDISRKNKTFQVLELKFLVKYKGDLSYVKAWYLHHLLDYLGGVSSLSGKEVVRRFKERMPIELVIDGQRFDFSQIIADIVSFVHKNLEEVLRDVRKSP